MPDRLGQHENHQNQATALADAQEGRTPRDRSERRVHRAEVPQRDCRMARDPHVDDAQQHAHDRQGPTQ